MRTSLLAALLLVPSVALAQPALQPIAPPAEVSGATLRNGMTFEANLGFGWIRSVGNGQARPRIFRSRASRSGSAAGSRTTPRSPVASRG